MSRRCDAVVRGTVLVELRCDECGRIEWLPARISTCGECPEYEALMQQGPGPGWARAGDCIVCGPECEQKFWDAL